MPTHGGLSDLLGIRASLSLEIQVTVPKWAPECVTGEVIENSRTLNFVNSGFEENWKSNAAHHVSSGSDGIISR